MGFSRTHHHAHPIRRVHRTVAAAALLLATLSIDGIPAAEPFSWQRAMEHVRFLAGTLGTRKTGTTGERGARDYIAEQMRGIGLEVRRIPVFRVGDTIVGSENIVGLLKGRTDDTILVSAHHDSRAVGVPGANDDASGVAVLLETARVLAADRPVSSVLFASFCAEEEGLLGARHFSRTEDLSRLRLVINMDPVGQREIFVSPFPTAPPLWASRALLSVAERERIAGVIGDPLYLLVTRSLTLPFGADHQPFLEKGVAAFSISDRFRVWAYHTDQDRPDWIDPTTLEAAGRSVAGLVRAFDERPPAVSPRPDDPTYVIVGLAGRRLMITTFAIMVLAATLVVIATLWWRSVWWKAARRGSRITRRDTGLALAQAGLPLAGAIAGALLSEALCQGITGLRFSWWSRQGMHLAQAGLFAVAGLSAGCRLAARRPHPDEPETTMILSVSFFTALAGIALAAGRPDVAFYFLLPAAATLGAATLQPSLAGLGTLIGSWPLLTLVTPGNYADAVAFADLSPPAWITGPAIFLLGLPIALGLARSIGPRGFARVPLPGWLGALAALAGVAMLVMNGAGPSYDTLNRRLIRVSETIDRNASAGRAEVRLASAEYLRGVKTDLPGLTLLDRRETTHTMTIETPVSLRGGEPTLTLQKAEGAEEAGAVDLRVVVPAPATVERLRIGLTSTESFGLLDDGVWIRRTELTRRHVYADDAPSETFRLSGATGQKIDVEIRLDLGQDILGVHASADDTVFQYASTITWRGSVVL